MVVTCTFPIYDIYLFSFLLSIPTVIVIALRKSLSTFAIFGPTRDSKWKKSSFFILKNRFIVSYIPDVVMSVSSRLPVSFRFRNKSWTHKRRACGLRERDRERSRTSLLSFSSSGSLIFPKNREPPTFSLLLNTGRQTIQTINNAHCYDQGDNIDYNYMWKIWLWKPWWMEFGRWEGMLSCALYEA